MTTEAHYALFETAIGPCGIAWEPRGVLAVLLPEKDEAAIRARLLRKLPGAVEAPPPPSIRRAIDGIVALLAGEARDLSGVSLDMGAVPAFNRRVYEVARAIGPGRTLSYGEVAQKLGDPALARDVGQALGANPFPIVVPCHRVVAAGGRLGGFSARGGAATKLRLLEIEGALKTEAPMLFDDLPRAVR